MDLHLRNVNPEILRMLRIEAATRGVTMKVVVEERLRSGGKSGANGASAGGGAKKVRRVGKGGGVSRRKRGAVGVVGGGVGGAGSAGVGPGNSDSCPSCPHAMTKHHGFQGACQVDNCGCAGSGQ